MHKRHTKSSPCQSNQSLHRKTLAIPVVNESASLNGPESFPFLVVPQFTYPVKSQYSTMASSSSLTTQNCTNCTTNIPDHEEEDDFVVAFSAENDIFPIAIAILIIAVNCWVVALVVLKRNLRTATNYILTSLAISDLCTGAIAIPLFLACNIVWETGVCVASMVAMRFTSISTVLHILTMTIDRYICIVYALRYLSWVTKRRGFHVIAFIWLVSLFMALIQLVWTDVSGDATDDRSPEEKRIYIIYDIVCFVAFVGIPVVFMAFTYGRILYEVHRQSRNIQQQNTPGWQETQRSTKREWKVAIIFLAMLFVFIVCWAPFYLLRLEQILGNTFFQINLSDVAQILLLWLRFSSSLINPCLYILGKPDFRKATGLIRKKRQRYNDSELTRTSQTKASSAV